MSNEHRRMPARWWCAGGFLVAVTLIAGRADATVLYVDRDAVGDDDGSSWSNAFVLLHDALVAAAGSGGAVDEIRVAEGTYTPDASDRNATFQLLDGVIVRGGFAGDGAPDSNLRDLDLHETVLSGDLGGNDTGAPDDPSHSENSQHVVTSSGVGPTAGLDGVTISGGNANDGGSDSGGGILNVSGSPRITNCTLVDNFALSFSINDGGGALFNSGSGQLTVVDCTFIGNESRRGGAIFSRNGSGSGPQIASCTFIANSASEGGAIHVNDEILIMNGLFVGNEGTVQGGAIWSDASGGTPRFVNCTFHANDGLFPGGAIRTVGSGANIVRNCVAWGDTPDEFFAAGASTLNVAESVVEGGFGAPIDNNLATDPLFVDPLAPGEDPLVATWDLRLDASSPAIDAGDDGAVPVDTLDLDGDGNTLEQISFDLAGNDRFIDGTGNTVATVDMGAYEFGTTNAPPDAVAIVQQLTDVGQDAIVRLDGSTSSDPEDPVVALTFEWFVNGSSVCLGDVVTCGTIEVALPFGSHDITLAVTDTSNATGVDDKTVTLDPAALVVLEARKVNVKWNHDPAKIKVSGEIGLPTGEDFTNLEPIVLAEVGLAGQIVVPALPLLMELSGDHKWKYRGPDSAGLVKKLDIDWKGAQFKFKQHGHPVELKTLIIGATETELEIKYKAAHITGGFTVDLGGLATATVDAAGLVTASVPFVVDKPGKEFTLTCPFELQQTDVIILSGGVDATVLVGDHYKVSVGRYKLEAKFNAADYPDGVDTSPRSLDLFLAIGEQLYFGSISLDENALRIDDGDKWKEVN